MKKLVRISTVPESLETFCKGQLKWLSGTFEVVAVSSPLPQLEIVREREGVRTVAIPMERHISFFKDVVSLCRLVLLFMKEKPDIVHSMTPKAGLLSMLAAWVCRVPIRMHTYTGLVFPTATGYTQRILIWMDRLLCFCANYINPEGKGVAGDLKAYKITKKPLHLIGNGNVKGIDLDYWNPDLYGSIRGDGKITREKLGLRADDLVFLFVGRLVGDKGINELVEAFRRMDDSQTKLLLVGPYENKLDPLKKETMNEIESNPRILTTGGQRDVRPYYAMADVFVFPSYREGFPNTVLEAGAMGLPSIVTDINGANEIIMDGQNGVLVPPRDVKTLYEKMQMMKENRDLRTKMASCSRERVVSRFEQKFIWNELMKTYKSFG
ncbi:MAG: glycosyltransferase family 4 protein [Prevotella sp.]|nr:glycosyltransferase family 4 protein [Prevotella sp.]